VSKEQAERGKEGLNEPELRNLGMVIVDELDPDHISPLDPVHKRA
jgi:hypothetical protein